MLGTQRNREIETGIDPASVQIWELSKAPAIFRARFGQAADAWLIHVPVKLAGPDLDDLLEIQLAGFGAVARYACEGGTVYVAHGPLKEPPLAGIAPAAKAHAASLD